MNIALVQYIVSTILLAYAVFAAFFALIYPLLARKKGEKQPEKIAPQDFSAKRSPDRVALVETPNDAFRSRMRMLAAAEHTIDIAYHTIGSGQTSEIFFGELLRAADRGVRVRFIVDGKMGGMSGGHLPIAYSLYTHPNIEYRVYNPFHPFKPWLWNGLLHDKFIIVDDKLLLLGGRNIGDIYFNPPGHTGRLTLDRDVLVFNTSFRTKISSESVITQATAYMDQLMSTPEAKNAFRVLSAPKRAIAHSTREWLLEQREQFEADNPELFSSLRPKDFLDRTMETQGVYLVANPVHAGVKKPQVATQIGQLAQKAEQSVIMQTPYATANKQLLRSLTEIGKKDLDFQMLTNSTGSTPNFPAFSNYYFQRRKFLATGATIYEFQERKGLERGSIHAKTYLFDHNVSAVGSLNLDDRSFYLSTETMLVINSPTFHDTLRDTIQQWQDDSLIVGSDNHYLPNQTVVERKTPLIKRLLLFLVSIFSRIFQHLI